MEDFKLETESIVLEGTALIVTKNTKINVGMNPVFPLDIKNQEDDTTSHIRLWFLKTTDSWFFRVKAMWQIYKWLKEEPKITA